jgi:hypothetical protein
MTFLEGHDFVPNAKVSHRSQPPVAFDLFLGQPAGSGWLDRFVELSRCAAKAFEQFGVDCHAASPRKPTTMAVHEKHQVFIHQQSQPSTAQRPSGYRSPSIEQVRT